MSDVFGFLYRKIFFKHDDEGNFLVQHISKLLNLSIPLNFSEKISQFNLMHYYYDGKVQNIIDNWYGSKWQKYLAFIDVEEEKHMTKFIPIEKLNASSIIFRDEKTVIFAKADNRNVFLLKISAENLESFNGSFPYDSSKEIKIMKIENDQIRGYHIKDSDFHNGSSIR